MDDARTHRPATDDRGVLDIQRLGMKRLAGALFGALLEEEQPDQVLAGRLIREIQQRLAFGVEACLHAARITDIEHVEQPQRRRIIAVGRFVRLTLR